MPSIEVGILGATGMVGQQFIALLADHPWFKVTYLGASERSAGKAFKDAAAWRLPNHLPEDVANRVVENAAPGTAPKLVFSGLDSSVAGEIEADAGDLRPVAQAYEEFQAEFPNSENADKALFNASVAWDAVLHRATFDPSALTTLPGTLTMTGNLTGNLTMSQDEHCHANLLRASP